MRFDEVNLDENVLQGIEAMNFQEMTPVQEQTIPVILEGKDIIGCAQTGTGKTAAYTLPLLSRLVAEGNPDNHIRAVIMVPTRELAQQIDMQFEGFSYFLPISTTVVYGGGDGAGGRGDGVSARRDLRPAAACTPGYEPDRGRHRYRRRAGGGAAGLWGRQRGLRQREGRDIHR